MTVTSITDAVIVHLRAVLMDSSKGKDEVAATVAMGLSHSTDSTPVVRSRAATIVTSHHAGTNGHSGFTMPARRRRRAAPVTVRVAGRWFQALTGIVVMVGLGVAQFMMLKARGHAMPAFVTLAAFVALAVLFFFIGRGIIHGRRWAWRGGTILAGTTLVFLVYAVANAPQPMGQRTIGVAVTVFLFGTPLMFLGLPSVRAFIASPTV
jgi:hypothetical protein